MRGSNVGRCQFDSRVEEITQNLVTLYTDHSNGFDIVHGERWYPEARRIVREWSAYYGYSIDTVACVIAAISPQCEWSRNLIIADDLLADRQPSIGGLACNIRKAINLRQGERLNDCWVGSIRERMLEQFPGGPKVNCFAQNLAGDNEVVTVDSHAMQAALNDVTSTKTLKWTPYSVFAGCYYRAAYAVGVKPAEFQAIIWHTWKRLNPPAAKRAKRRQWEILGEI